MSAPSPWFVAETDQRKTSVDGLLDAYIQLSRNSENLSQPMGWYLLSRYLEDQSYLWPEEQEPMRAIFDLLAIAILRLGDRAR